MEVTDDKSTLVQVMAWCHQATSHYLSQCCARSTSPYGVTRPQWVKLSREPSWFNNNWLSSTMSRTHHGTYRNVGAFQCDRFSLLDIHWIRSGRYTWFSARLQYLQCVSNGNTAVLHWAIDKDSLFSKGLNTTRIGLNLMWSFTVDSETRQWLMSPC